MTTPDATALSFLAFAGRGASVGSTLHARLLPNPGRRPRAASPPPCSRLLADLERRLSILERGDAVCIRPLVPETIPLPPRRRLTESECRDLRRRLLASGRSHASVERVLEGLR